MASLENLRTEAGRDKQTVIRTSAGSRMFSMGVLYLKLHLPGYHTDDTCRREDIFRMGRRAFRLELMRQGVGFDVL